MEQDSVGESENHKRGLVFRKNDGQLMLVEDEGNNINVQSITDYNGIYTELKDDEASIVDVIRQPMGGRVLRDIAIMSFCNNHGETPCTAEAGIEWALKNDSRHLLMLIYNDPELKNE